ncbi:MAG: hypothetical protein WCP19_06090 [Chloroflexota bacterium]
MNFLKIMVLYLIVLLLISSCNLPSRPTSVPGIDQAAAGTIVAATLQALITPTSAFTESIINTPVPAVIAASPTSQLTETPTVTITPTYSVPMFSFTENTNCRQGPGTQFSIVSLIRAGQQVEGVGVQGKYWIVKDPRGKGTCWVPSEFASAAGSTWTLPTVEAPPTATGAALIAPTWSNWSYFCSADANSNLSMSMTLKWSDRSATEQGYKIYRNGELIATLPAGSTTYTDISAVSGSTSLAYYIESYNSAGSTKSSTISASCN